MKEELVSVVVPIYKVEQFIEKCIKSIINQTYKSIEIILVDDGSPDNCGKICDEYATKDERIKVIHKENGGLSDARNAGINIANGTYITFIDSDDYVDEKFIEILLQIIKRSNAKISMCGIKKVYNNGRESEDIEIPDEKILTGKEMILRLGDYPISNIVAWNKLYNINLFEKIRYPKGKIHEDEFTTYKLLYECKKVAITNEKLYYYMQNEGSITNQKFNKSRLDIIQALEERSEFFKNKKEKDLYLSTLNKYLEIIIYIYNIGKEDMQKNQLKDLQIRYKRIYRELRNEHYILNKKRNKYMFYIMPNIYYFLSKIKNKVR